MSESKEIRVMRMQAWCRAKGELDAVLHSYWGDQGEDGSYQEMDKLTKQFIKAVEDNGLQE